jgi:hypothetical protein
VAHAEQAREQQVAPRLATSMVMPCSRSASRPSVRSERSISAAPRRSEARWTAESWSCWMARAS